MMHKIPGFFFLLLCYCGLTTNVVHASCTSKPAPEVNWSSCKKSKKVLSGRDLTKATLTLTDFSSSNLSRATLVDANLERAILTRTNFKNAELQGARLQKALGYRTQLANANMTGADLTKAEFSRGVLPRRHDWCHFAKFETGQSGIRPCHFRRS